MRKSINPLTPTQVYCYAVQACQPHLKLGGPTKALGSMIMTVVFAAAARVSSLSDTCRRLQGVPDEHVVADALYATLPGPHCGACPAGRGVLMLTWNPAPSRRYGPPWAAGGRRTPCRTTATLSAPCSAMVLSILR